MLAPTSSSQGSSRLALWRGLPNKPGVYIYKDLHKTILYVGKAINLRARTRSYFQPPEKLGAKTAKLVSLIASVETIVVQSEIEALLLESTLIRKFKPPFNIALKDSRDFFYINISKDAFPRPLVNHDGHKPLAGPFLNSRIPKDILRTFRKIAPYCLNSTHTKVCFYAHLGLCNPCPGNKTTTKQAYAKNIKLLTSLLSGKLKTVKQTLLDQIKIAVRNLDFEQANILKTKISHIDYILHKPIRPTDYVDNPNLLADKYQEAQNALALALNLAAPPKRIELYDIANISGTSATAAMTVAIDGEVQNKLFRHFKITWSQEPNDVLMLQEALTRRLNHLGDWGIPDLIVLDGGKAQLSVINKLTLPCLVLSLAKQEELIIIPNDSGFQELKLPKENKGLMLLQRLRDEAHRFSRRLHHKLRTKMYTA